MFCFQKRWLRWKLWVDLPGGGVGAGGFWELDIWWEAGGCWELGGCWVPRMGESLSIVEGTTVAESLRDAEGLRVDESLRAVDNRIIAESLGRETAHGRWISSFLSSTAKTERAPFVLKVLRKLFKFKLFVSNCVPCAMQMRMLNQCTWIIMIFFEPSYVHMWIVQEW